MPSNIHQLGGSPVRNLILAENRIGYIPLHIPRLSQHLRPFPQQRRILPVRNQHVSGSPAGPKQRGYAQQHSRAQRPALFANRECLTRIREFRHRMSADILQNHRRFLGLPLSQLNIIHGIKGNQLPALFRPDRGQRAFGQHLPNPRKLQYPQCSFRHHAVFGTSRSSPAEKVLLTFFPPAPAFRQINPFLFRHGSFFFLLFSGFDSCRQI